jgi:hypothetical protein
MIAMEKNHPKMSQITIFMLGVRKDWFYINSFAIKIKQSLHDMQAEQR